MPEIKDAYKIVTVALTTTDSGLLSSSENLMMKNVNIHCYGADAYYGDGVKVNEAVQSSVTPTCSIIRANAVVWFENCYLRSLFFKSYVNATPAYIVITGTI
jgi:hypothetical protein